METYSKTLLSIDEIPENNYHGYLWMSDKNTPLIIDGTIPYDQLRKNNPFIVEGNLISTDRTISITIRNAGNVNIIKLFDIKKLNEVSFTENIYVVHRLDDYKHVCFNQYWLPEADPLCEGFEVLKPAFQVFMGLVK